MPEFILDLIEPHRVTNSVQGVEVVRGCLVKDIEITEDPLTGSDVLVFLRLLSDAACPKIDDPISADSLYEFIKLAEHRLVSVGRSEQHCRIDLVYRGPQQTDVGGGPGQPIVFSIEDGYAITHITNYSTTNGGFAITVWYKPGGGIGPPPADVQPKAVGVHKMRVHRAIRATGFATKAQWDTIKEGIRGVAEHINADTWGGHVRGTWFFTGPNVRKSTGSNLVIIELMFLNDPDKFFPVTVFINDFGDHPSDSVTEAALRADNAAAGGIPGVSGIIQASGITIASQYKEANFSSIFGFDPSST